MDKPKNIIVSAVNLTEGGPLTILNACLKTLSDNYGYNYNIIAIVHDKNLCEYPNIEYLNYPKIKKSWIKRIYFEYFYLKKLSLRLRPYLWFSLHDMTPNVISEKQVVYCHNSTPLYKTRLRDLYFSRTIFLYTLFYKYLYKINIKKNTYIVVQQNWIREAFSSIFNLSKNKIIVATPILQKKDLSLQNKNCFDNKGPYRFFYPAFPRLFKNFELLCEAVKILYKNIGNKFEVIITINGNENKYARWVYRKYKNISQIKFVGLLSTEQIEEYYQSSNCLVFPSKLESWGLPISEFIPYRKPILVSNLEYAYETAMGADMVDFFDVNKVENLADKMRLLINGNQNFLKPCKKELINEPFANSWKDLFKILLNE